MARVQLTAYGLSLIHIYYFSHPNIFSVQLEGETEVELGEVKSKVDKLKQSHTVYLLSVILMLIECT